MSRSSASVTPMPNSAGMVTAISENAVNRKMPTFGILVDRLADDDQREQRVQRERHQQHRDRNARIAHHAHQFESRLGEVGAERAAARRRTAVSMLFRASAFMQPPW